MSVQGLDRLNKRFRDLPEDAAKKIYLALEKGGIEVADAAASLAPQAERDLVESIHSDVRPLPDDKGAQAIITAGYTYDDPDTYDALGAKQQEFGRAPSSDHPGHEAQPFMFPAYRLNKTRVLGRIKRAIKAAVKIVK